MAISRRIIVGALATLALIIVAIVAFILTSARETPSAVAGRALNALAALDERALGEAVRGDEAFTTALEHLDAVEEPIAAVKVEDVTEWLTADGVDQARVTYSFSVGSEEVEGELVAVREPSGETYARFPVLMGDVQLVDTEGGRAQLTKAVGARGSVPLLPGVYAVHAEDLRFPYALDKDAVTVSPGSSAAVAPSPDDDAVGALLEEIAESAHREASVAAETALTDESIPVDRLTTFGQPGRGFHVKSVTASAPPSFNEGVCTFTFSAVFGAEEYYGSLIQDWIPVEGFARVTITVPVDPTGQPLTASSSFDAGDLVWASTR